MEGLRQSEPVGVVVGVGIVKDTSLEAIGFAGGRRS